MSKTLSQSTGFCVHPGIGTHNDVNEFIRFMQRVKCTRVRLRATSGQLGWVPALKAAGLHVSALVYSVADADAAVAAKCDRLEYRNEPNLQDGSNWPSLVQSDSAAIYAKYAGKIECMNSALGAKKDYDAMGLVVNSDRGNVHMYPGGDTVYNTDGSVKIAGWDQRLVALKRVHTEQRKNNGFKPTSHTETGFHTTSNSPATETHRPTTEQQMADRVIDWYLTCMALDDELYWYDYKNDGTSTTDRESNFGWLRADGSEKPVVAVFAAFMTKYGNYPVEAIPLIDKLAGAPTPAPTTTQPVANPTPWAVAIPDLQSGEWQNVQTRCNVQADGLVGRATLDGIVAALDEGDRLEATLHDTTAQLADTQTQLTAERAEVDRLDGLLSASEPMRNVLTQFQQAHNDLMNVQLP